MKYTLRPYQQKASDIAYAFFTSKVQENAIIVAPTGCGKSLIISDIANRLNSQVLVFSPSKEITEQNLAKMKTYTDDCSAFSASVGEKKISKITYATIGSVKAKVEDFKHFRYVIIDEAHGVCSEKGMYLNFLSMLGCKVLGLTATPFRLTADTVWKKDAKIAKDDAGNVIYNADGTPKRVPGMTTVNAKLTMLINEDKPFFDRILYTIQISDMLKGGYIAPLKYYDVRPPRWNPDKIFKNTMGTDFSEKSVKFMMESSDLTSHIASLCSRLLRPKSGIPRNGILVFTQFVEDAEDIANSVNEAEGRYCAAFVSGQTTKKNRERILQEFNDGTIQVLLNVGCFTTGLDVPKLDTIVIGRPTLSLAMHYQIVGRALRLFEDKDAWIVDCVGNTDRFGEVANLYIGESTTGQIETFGWVRNKHTNIYGWKQLTGVILNPKEPEQKTINFR